MIRRAKEKDINDINSLLYQVLEIHQKGRPDMFKPNTKKYTDEQIKTIINDDNTPVFVYDEDDRILGYAFCVLQQHIDNNVLTDVKTLYIDDLCVDENSRGKSIGKQLFEYVKCYAKEIGCYNITLNVWTCNKGAISFYEKMGLIPQKTVMETML